MIKYLVCRNGVVLTAYILVLLFGAKRRKKEVEIL